MVKNPPSNAGDTGSIPGRGARIPHAAGQLSPRTTATEPTCSGARTTTREKPAHGNEEPMRCDERSRMPQLRPDAAKNK